MVKENKKINGKADEFDLIWKQRKEALYNHWARGRPKNQIQLAFRKHWEVFNELLGDSMSNKGKSLEVGCGRGSMSSYFAENGWDVTLLDSSRSVLETAKMIYANNGHKAAFIEGDANRLNFPDNTFDVVFSIGLLEHFEDVYTPIYEQWRVLKAGGLFLGYIVPERPDNIQHYFKWINRILKVISSVFKTGRKDSSAKEPIFRNDFDSSSYLEAIRPLGVINIRVFGMYPLPMISHSPEFPFSLLPSVLEWLLTRCFEFALFIRRLITKRNGWICSEKMGQAFLIVFQK